MARRWPPDPGTPRGIAGQLLGLPVASGFPAPDLSDVLVWRDPARPWLIQMWEPLHTKAPAPPKARPYCCYVRTVIFQHFPYIVQPPHPVRYRGRMEWSKGGGWLAWDQVESRISFGLIRFEGQWFEVGGGSVVWKRRRWWMVWDGHRGTRAARLANGVAPDGPSWTVVASAG